MVKRLWVKCPCVLCYDYGQRYAVVGIPRRMSECGTEWLYGVECRTQSKCGVQKCKVKGDSRRGQKDLASTYVLHPHPRIC